VEQAVLGLEAYFQLASHQPAPPGLDVEAQRAEALWQTLADMAALWPEHPDNPARRAPSPSSRDTEPPRTMTAA
jgi:hypothetical protein